MGPGGKYEGHDSGKFWSGNIGKTKIKTEKEEIKKHNYNHLIKDI